MPCFCQQWSDVSPVQCEHSLYALFLLAVERCLSSSMRAFSVCLVSVGSGAMSLQFNANILCMPCFCWQWSDVSPVQCEHSLYALFLLAVERCLSSSMRAFSVCLVSVGSGAMSLQFNASILCMPCFCWQWSDVSPVQCEHSLYALFLLAVERCLSSSI